MYIIQEIQTTGNQTALTPAITELEKAEAESKFHLACSSAAVSQVDVHVVMWFDEHGNTIDKKCYEHVQSQVE